MRLLTKTICWSWGQICKFMMFSVTWNLSKCLFVDFCQCSLNSRLPNFNLYQYSLNSRLSTFDSCIVLVFRCRRNVYLINCNPLYFIGSRVWFLDYTLGQCINAESEKRGCDLLLCTVLCKLWYATYSFCTVIFPYM